MGPQARRTGCGAAIRPGSSAASPAARMAGRRARSSPAVPISRAAARRRACTKSISNTTTSSSTSRAPATFRARSRAGPAPPNCISGHGLGAVRRSGVLRGIRIVTDARPEHRNDTTEANHKRRADAYLLGGVMAARFDIDAARDCVSLPPAEGESAVGIAVRQAACEKNRRGERAAPGPARQPLPQARPERRQSAVADPTDPGPVRKLGAAGNPSACRRRSGAHGRSRTVGHDGIPEHRVVELGVVHCGTAKIRSREQRLREIGAAKIRAERIRIGEVGAHEARTDQLRPDQPRLLERGPVELGIAQKREVERHPGEVRPDEDRVRQPRLAQVGAAQTSPGSGRRALTAPSPSAHR